MPITVVQQLLGHSSIENAMIYTAIVQQEAREFLRGWLDRNELGILFYLRILKRR